MSGPPVICPSIICLGAIGLDTVLKVSSIPAAPAKVLASDCVQLGAGMASSAAAAIARLGGRAELWGRVGDDAAGRQTLADLADAGVDVARVRIVAGGRTPISTILVDDSGQRLVVPYYDPALDRDAGWLPVDRVAGVDAVLADPRWPEGAARLLTAARAAGKFGVLDADVAPIPVLERLLPLASHAVLSEPALTSLVGDGGIERGLAALAARLGRPVGVTAGERGFFWWTAGRIIHAPAPGVAVVDTLSAGDVFHGAFVLALAEGWDIADAGRFACVAASLKCRRFGGRLGAPGRDEVDAFLATGNNV